VPIYGINEDFLALEQLQNIYKYCIIEPIKFDSIIKNGGALHCVSSEKMEFEKEEKRDKREF
jgi:agmatine deiminase